MAVVIEGKRDEVKLTLDRVEAAALLHAADTGFRVIEALSLVQKTATTEVAVTKLRHAVMTASPASSGRRKR